MTSFTEMFGSTSSKIKLLVVIVAAAVLYGFYVDDLSTNPPGFYLDESAGSYNAYLIAKTGASEFGDLPIYPKYYTESRSEQGNPLHLYMLAAMYVFVPPSVVSARVLAATTVFIACLLLGLLARRLSRRDSIGIIVAVTAIFTPWLFDASRLVLEVFTYPLAVVVFLLALHIAQRRERWLLRDIVLIALGLGLVMYGYSIGRLLAPAFAFGLLLFASSRARLLSIVKTWLAFAVTLIPYAYFTFTKPGAASKRFLQVTYLSWDRPIWDNISDFFSAYFSDFSATFLLYDGDPLLRHHLPHFGEMLAPTVMLAGLGLIVVAARMYRSSWWLFIVYGLLVSVLPGALTTQRYHSLRLSALPVFIIVLGIPALSFLLGDRSNANGTVEYCAKPWTWVPRTAGVIVIVFIAGLSTYQAYDYRSAFAGSGTTRGYAFDDAYLSAFKRAVEEPTRPIYLEDGFWGPAYVHAFWYAAVQGIPQSDFVHLAEADRPPIGALVLSSNEKCTHCEIVKKSGPYLLYRVIDRDEVRDAPPTPLVLTAFVGGEGSERSQFKAPRGLVVVPDGTIIVADSGNDRLQRFDAAGRPAAIIARPGTEMNQFKDPNGIAIDDVGNIYFTDASNHKIVKVDPNGQPIEEVQGPGNGLYGPRDIAFGPDRKLYIVDQGRTRIVRYDPASKTFESFGEPGSGDGQFSGSTGIAIGGGFVFVADTGNNRIEVFDMDMKFVRQWQVPEWEKYIWHYPDLVYDDEKSILYVTNGWKSEILAFDPDGTPLPDSKPRTTEALNNPSAITLANVNGKRSLFVLNMSNPRVTKIDLN